VLLLRLGRLGAPLFFGWQVLPEQVVKGVQDELVAFEGCLNEGPQLLYCHAAPICALEVLGKYIPHVLFMPCNPFIK